MKKSLRNLLAIFIVLTIGFIYYYIALPAVNIHAHGFWYFIIGLLLIITVLTGILSNAPKSTKEGKISSTMNKKLPKAFILITGAAVIIYLIGSLLSSPIVNASKYQKLISPEDRDFTTDIKEISFQEIPLLDKDSAAMLGSRKMGTMVEYVSQFEVSPDYTQINYQEKPFRVTPLRYGSVIKWLTNQKEGIPAYIRIDMATQEVECVKLPSGIRYSESELFGRNIHRYLRFRYPTYIFDTINFEINDEGVPYWICPVKDYKIGLFGGQTVSNVVLVNAITGEHENYKLNDCPTWVDRVFPAELLISYYDYYGTLKHGFLNTLFSQKDCLETTDGYNYLALEDDVWIYTGVTSVGGDQSNVGFVLMNQRTAETRYYSIPGAEEYSAMSSAEGKVQNLGYRSTFPLLLNIADEPTYFIALKDASGLVKKFAMVNVEKYQIVAIGDSVAECEKTYIALMKENGITVSGTASRLTASGRIRKIAEAVVSGDSHYYILLEGREDIFDVLVGDYIEVVRYEVGDYITFTYTEDEPMNVVVGVN